MSAILRTEQATKKFLSASALEDISFDLHAGYTYGLLGRNGAGKTTLIKTMLNQIKLDKGSVFWKESEIKRGDYLYKRDIGYVPDHDDMLEKLTAKEIIEFAAFAYQVPEAVFQERMNHLLDVFQLEHTAAPVQTFSRGMRKKCRWFLP